VILTDAERQFVAEARRASLATIDARGRPRLVPICFVLVDEDARPVIYTPIDEKPKLADDPFALARVRDVLARPAVGLLIDRWSEDWSQLAWLRLAGEATFLQAGAAGPEIVAGLRAKYPQYADHRLESRPALRIEIASAASWGAISPSR
jgi:PPOX class probable F420-dependent enzyme